MLWVAVGLIVVSALSFLIGFVLFANGAGVAPHRRTKEDPTGVKRAGSRVAFPDMFRRIPSSLNTLVNKEAERNERLTAVGSLFVLAAVLAACGAILALIAAFV